MNINNIDADTNIPEDVWKAIFDKQNELAQKYKDIEGMGNLLESTAFNLDTREGQIWIKDFAWRVTEEMAEAQEAYNFAMNDSGNADQHFEHFVEELIDALHFLVEMSIIAGYDHNIVPTHGNGNEELMTVAYYLGLSCNCLKNKRWKQTQLLTDREKFKELFINVWMSLLSLFDMLEMGNEEIYEIYFKKNEVNKFRIRSQY